MDDAPAAAPKPCCICAEPGGKYCTKCKSRNYCGKKCQLADWNEGGHKAQCKQIASGFQDRLLDELMPAKKVKEEPAIVEEISPADGSDVASPSGSRAAARAPAVRAEKTAQAKAAAATSNAPHWRGTCAICLNPLPFEGWSQTFYDCCCASLCSECTDACVQYDTRCPLCRAAAPASEAEALKRLQQHAVKGNAEAQFMLGDAHGDGDLGLKKSAKRALKWFELAAAQGHARSQCAMGNCYDDGAGVKINFKTAAQWHRRAADQGYPDAQCNMGTIFYFGKGVAQSFEEAARWWRLAAQQGHMQALYDLGGCYVNGIGVPQDLDEALRCFERAAAKGHADADATIERLAAFTAESAEAPVRLDQPSTPTRSKRPAA